LWLFSHTIVDGLFGRQRNFQTVVLTLKKHAARKKFAAHVVVE
jgi:hypothetical protein